MAHLLLIVALLGGCVALEPREIPVVLEPAPKLTKVYVCEPGQYGNFMIIGANVFLVIIRPDGEILEVCAIPAQRLIIVGSPQQET